MRAILLLATAAALAGCMTQPPPESQAAEAQAEFQRLTAGKVAGPRLTCLPSTLRSPRMTAIDDSTVVFEGTGSRTYVNQLRSPCGNLRSGFYTLVTRTSGSSLCSGDIAEVADLRTGITVGSCSLGDFVPYTMAGR